MLGAVGVTAIETRVAEVTTSETAGEVAVPNVAVTWQVPVDTVVARPAVPAELLTVATEVLSEIHVTWLVRFCVE
jgi:hypothetical protein